MQTTTTNDRGAGSEANSQTLPAEVATQPQSNKLARTVVLGAAALATPLALGTGIAALTRSRRAGLIAGAATLATFAALRWQLQRLFTDEPAYEIERRIGELEIRRYAPRVEAHTRIKALDFETSLDEGFSRLAEYIFGGNDGEQKLAMTVPVTNTPRATTHTVAFVMPPGRSLAALPKPTDARVSLVNVPARRIAALRYHGRYTGAIMLEQTRRLHELVVAADLETTGQPVFAGYDPPTTLPLLRRAEIWIELV